MPRKPKEVIEKEEIIENVEKKKTRKSTSSTKKVASSTTKKGKDSKAKETSKKSTAKTKKAENKSVVVEKESKTKKAPTKKASTSTTVKETKPKKTTTKTATKSSTKKTSASTTVKETKTKKASTKTATKSSTKKATTTRTKKAVAIPEYYDLPYHYDQTVVKVLAQTPKTLFVYWDVSNEDKEKYEKQFGPNFFNNTVPFLRVKNETNNYYFDVDVDDFANGWYLEVEDSKCNYSIELLRKQRPYTEKVIEQPIYITSSNKMETPNDRILFDTNFGSVNFKNVKTNQVTTKNISKVALNNVSKIYNIYDLYKKIYKNEDVGDIFDLTNPSSGNPTSTFK